MKCKYISGESAKIRNIGLNYSVIDSPNIDENSKIVNISTMEYIKEPTRKFLIEKINKYIQKHLNHKLKVKVLIDENGENKFKNQFIW